MKGVKFLIGLCTKGDVKYYFHYNNRTYFILEIKDSEETVLDKSTNPRYAYEKWRGIKADSDEAHRPDDYEPDEDEIRDRYLPRAFMYELEYKPKVEESKITKKKVVKRTDDKFKKNNHNNHNNRRNDRKNDRYSH